MTEDPVAPHSQERPDGGGSLGIGGRWGSRMVEGTSDCFQLVMNRRVCGRSGAQLPAAQPRAELKHLSKVIDLLGANSSTARCQ